VVGLEIDGGCGPRVEKGATLRVEGKGLHAHRPPPPPPQTRRPISSVIPYDGWVALMNAGIFVHCLITYQIIINVWSASFLHIVLPRRAVPGWVGGVEGVGLWGGVRWGCGVGWGAV